MNIRDQFIHIFPPLIIIQRKKAPSYINDCIDFTCQLKISHLSVPRHQVDLEK